MAAPRVLKSVASRMCLPSSLSTVATRAMSVNAAHSRDVVEFPRAGVNYDALWAAAGEGVTVRGQLLRNAPVSSLLAALTPSQVKLTTARAVEERDTSAIPSAPIFATDRIASTQVMDVEEYEGRLASVKQQVLSYAPTLFVEDAAIGSTRSSELRVRVITDSPLVALALRSLLHRIPVYSPEVFPRTLTVFIATLGSDAVEAGAPLPGAKPEATAFTPYAAIDVDTAAASGTVMSVGRVSIATIQTAIATAAASLYATGGYRHVPGGNHNPNIREARSDGILSWYLRDGHYYAPSTEAHPDLLPLPNCDIITDGSKSTLVIGSKGGVAAAAASKGRLFASQGAIWHATEGLSALWAGLSLPQAAYAAVSKALPLPRGAVSAFGSVVMPLASPAKSVVAPTKIVVLGKADALGEKAQEKLAARTGGGKVTVTNVADDAEALAALGLSSSSK